jgi:hypothetical protein
MERRCRPLAAAAEAIEGAKRYPEQVKAMRERYY